MCTKVVKVVAVMALVAMARKFSLSARQCECHADGGEHDVTFRDADKRNCACDILWHVAASLLRFATLGHVEVGVRASVIEKIGAET